MVARALLEDRRWLGAAALLLGCFAVLAAEFRTTTLLPVSLYDEGVILVSAERMRAGQLPYRDYDAVYGPLEPALYAALGPDVLRLRLLRASALAALAALSVVYVRRLGGGAVAPLAGAAVVAAASNLVHPGLALVAGVGPLLARGLERGRLAPLLAAGACVGLAGLARMEFGALAALTATGTVAVHAWQRREGWARPLRRVGTLLAGALPAAGVYGVLWAKAPERFASSVLAIQRHGLGDVRAYTRLPYPLPPPDGASWWWFKVGFALVPPCALVIGLGILCTALARRRKATLDPHAVFLILALPGLFLYGLARADPPHLFPSFALGLTLLLGLSGPALHRSRARSAVGRVSVAVLAGALLVRVHATWEARTAEPLTALRTRSMQGLLGPRDFDAFYDGLRRRVDALAPEGTPLFVGLGMTRADGTVVPDHTRIYTSDALVYVILDRRPAVRQHCLVPGWTTTAGKQAELVVELEATRVPLVLLRLDAFREGQDESLQPGADVLDRYLMGNFRPVEQLGRYLLLAPR